ncbi:hypothetical protein A3715_37495 [Oleiphilus sp. HI0009]|uniref:hypothetical protein n=1 Tax=Oleiphilus sp. HI0125 TaxID=1822266 RepID=UPI0007C3CD64|nr:hypothetical protein [Oleiphilus sp. HI0125]KZX72611.1 hypothetical protein A3715_03155 [Oleiphilus sp. HI0009]KZX80566.1 hypothetical protein A3715_37495 [Oleiphilus sp. HI0009]KZZ63444.1 hypothetical protein A3762_00180 [Oleiphilus sp. HI0125]MCH2158350.1 hypothetical protein [Oleiphilaceae bacterium]
MSTPSIAHTINEFMSFSELLDDAYWEASSITDKDFIYDIHSMFLLEIGELNKLSIQDHHYPYEFITEGIRRIVPKVEELEQRLSNLIPRTKTLIDMRDILSNILVILEAQNEF